MGRLKKMMCILLGVVLVSCSLLCQASQSPAAVANSLVPPEPSKGNLQAGNQVVGIRPVEVVPVAVVGPPIGTVAVGAPQAISPAISIQTIPAPKNTTHPCTCGVFLSGQFKKGSTDQPTGSAAFMQEQEKSFPCTAIGARQCQNKCVEILIKYLPNSATLLCGTIDRDCHKERAFLFVQNCNEKWVNSNLSAGKEYCCKDGESYPCPLI